MYAPPAMWADALDRMLARIARPPRSTSRTSAPFPARRNSTAASTSIEKRPTSGAESIPSQPLAPQLQGMFSRDRDRRCGWMRHTAVQCREIDAALGGPDRTKALTGSPACERFTGPQIRRFFQQRPDAYHETARVHLVSSFLASLLTGGDAPIDPGDGSGMNLMDLAHNRWSPEALDATAPDLRRRLPPTRAAMGARRPARAVLAAALHAAGGRGAGVDRRQPVEPDRNRHHPRPGRRRSRSARATRCLR